MTGKIGMTPLPKIDRLPVPTMGISPKIEAVPTLPRLVYPNVYKPNILQTTTQIAPEERSPSDPLALNSLADIFSRSVKEANFPWMKQTHQELPILGDLITAFTSASYVVLNPFSQIANGETEKGLMNIMSNVSETFDIFANPIRSLVTPYVNQKASENPMLQLPWYERLGAGLGFSEYGHYNYEYDTGFWLTDFGLELLSDPIDLIQFITTLGASAVVDSKAKFLQKTLKDTLNLSRKPGIRAIKQASKRTLKDTVQLSKTADIIADTLKVFGDNGLNVASDSIKVAVLKNNGIIDDATKDAVDNAMTLYLKNSASLTAKNPKVAKELEDLFAYYKRYTDYNMFDYLTDMGWHIGVEGAENLQHLKFFKGTLPYSYYNRAYRKAVKKGKDDVAEAMLEKIKILLSSPANVKKYRKVLEETPDTIAALSKIKFTDYLQAANDALQFHRTFKILNAADALMDTTDNIQKAILKLALVYSNPVGAIIYSVIKYYPKIGNKVGTWFMKKAMDIGVFFAGKTLSNAMFDFDDMVEVYNRTFQQYDLFSGAKFAESEFAQPLAKSVYDDTLKWLSGYSDATDYVVDPDSTKVPNLWTAPPEVRTQNIWQKYETYFRRNKISQEQCEEFFWLELDRIGHLAHTGTPLETVNISDYLKLITPTDSELQLRNMYEVFNAVISKADNALNSPKMFIKQLSDNDIKIAASQTSKAKLDLSTWMDTEKLGTKIQEEVKAVGLKISNRDSGLFAKGLRETQEALQQLEDYYTALDFYKKTKASEEIINLHLMKIDEQVKSVKGHIEQLRNNVIRKLKNKPQFKKTPFSKVYKSLEKILSPYFGKANHVFDELDNLFELRAANLNKTLALLNDPEIAAFRDSFREGGTSSNALKTARTEALKTVKYIQRTAETDRTAKQKLALFKAQKLLTKLNTIEQNLAALDNFEWHYALVKQSQMPEVMQQIYFEVIEEFPIQKAKVLFQDKANVVNEFVRRMNEKLSGRFSVHYYNNDYYAQRLLSDKTYAPKARRYINSNQDAIEDAEFTSVLFKALVLPEFSKIKKVDIAGKEVDAVMHRAYAFHQNRDFVYLDFETTGDNAYLDQIFDIGFYNPNTEKPTYWSYTHNNFDLEALPRESKNRILSRRTPIEDATGTDELSGLLQLYKQLRDTLTSSKKPITFVTSNRQEQNLQIILTRLQHYAELANADGDGGLVRKLNTIIEWFQNNVLSANLQSMDLLKKFDGIPTVGEHYASVERLLTAYLRRQYDNNSILNLILDENFVTELKNIEGINVENYEQVLLKASNILNTLDTTASTWGAKGAAYSLEGRTIIDASIYNKNSQAIYSGSEDFNSIQVDDTADLLNYTEAGYWEYKGEQLPLEIQTADDAVKYLKEVKGETYAPKWLALNPEQQVSTYPVLINGHYSLQNISGVVPVKFTKYIDGSIMLDYFRSSRASYSEQHLLTTLAQQMSSVISQVKDFRHLDDLASSIDSAFKHILDYAMTQGGYSPYRLLKPDLDTYHKYAVLVVLLRDNSPGAPVYKLKKFLMQEEFVTLRKSLYTPEYYSFKISAYSRIFDSYRASRSTDYASSFYSREDFLENILKSEQTAGTVQARYLRKAIEDNSADIKHITENLKKSLDENEVYTPVMQRRAILGRSHTQLNDAYIKLIDKLKEGPEYNAFMACNNQLVNNLDDLMFSQILAMQPKQLQSLVYHQGKGVIILPIGHYLKDNSFHSFDLKESCQGFISKYSTYEDEFIACKKQGDNLIIYAKDYEINLKQEKVEFIPLQAIDMNLAFKAAYGYPAKNADEKYKAYKEALKSLKRYPENSPKYVEETVKLANEFKEYGVYSKQTTFLFTHWDDIEELRKAHINHHKKLTKLAIDYDDDFSGLIGGYGRVATYENILEVHQKLPTDIRRAIYGGEEDELVRKLYDIAPRNSFNFTTFGRAAYRKDYEYFSKSSYQSVVTDTYRELSSRLSAMTQYSNFFFADSDLRLDNLFKNATPEETFQALYENEDYTVAILKVDDTKGTAIPKLQTITVRTMADVEYAMKNKAVLFPNITFASFAQTVYAKAWDNPVLKLFSKVNYFLKASMLIKFGTLFRNFLDSTLKNILTSKDTSKLGESYIDAMNLYAQYTSVVQDLFRLSPDESNPFKPDVIEIYFQDSTRVMDKDTFSLIHNFIENGPSAGSIGEVSEFYLNKSLQKTGKVRKAIQRIYEVLLEPTKQVEQITRLALYLDLIKKNMTNSDAFRIITKTHFDYGTKSNLDRIIEFFIPFYSFQKKNFAFWLEYAAKNPAIAYILLQGISSQWHLEDLDINNAKYYQGKLNQILSGNILLNEKGLTLKINPSFMDPINILLNPIGSFSGKLTPIVGYLTDVFKKEADAQDFINTLVPLTGAVLSVTPLNALSTIGGITSIAASTTSQYMSAPKHMQRSGSALPIAVPSLFSSTYTGRATYNNPRTYTDYTKRVPRIRNTNIYNRLYTDTGKNRWQMRYMPIDNFTIYWRIRESTNIYR